VGIGPSDVPGMSMTLPTSGLPAEDSLDPPPSSPPASLAGAIPGGESELHPDITAIIEVRAQNPRVIESRLLADFFRNPSTVSNAW
jgi:hypothetical protein